MDKQYTQLQEALSLGLFGLVYGLREGDTLEEALKVLLDELTPLLDRPPYAMLAIEAGLSLEDALKVEQVVESAERWREGEVSSDIPQNVIDFAKRLQANRTGSSAKGTSGGYEKGTSEYAGTPTERDTQILAMLRAGKRGEEIFRAVGGKRANTMRRIAELRKVA